jgi:hypothetical protein
MITRREIAVGLYAAWRMFLRDPKAIELFDGTPAGTIKSFFCAAIVLPGYGLILGFSPAIEGSEAGLFELILINASAYVAGWAAWPLAMHYIAPAIHRDDAYCRYIAAYNWASGPYILIVLVMYLPMMLGLVPPQFLVLLNLVAMMIMLFYHLFIVRVALRIRPLGAIAIVIAEYFLGDFILTLRHAALV